MPDRLDYAIRGGEKQVNICIQTGSVKYCQGDREGRPIRINLPTSPSTSVGARVDDEGLGGPLWSPASCSSGFHLGGTRSPPHPAGDPKGPPNPSSSSLAPTDRSASCLTSRLRLMRIGRPQGRPVTLSSRVRAGLAPALGTVSYHSHYARNFVSWQHIIIKGCGLYLK